VDQAAVAVENTKTGRQRVSGGLLRLFGGPQRVDVSPDWRRHRAANVSFGSCFGCPKQVKAPSYANN
jgi:hypothetical protein